MRVAKIFLLILQAKHKLGTKKMWTKRHTNTRGLFLYIIWQRAFRLGVLGRVDSTRRRKSVTRRKRREISYIPAVATLTNTQKKKPTNFEIVDFDDKVLKFPQHAKLTNNFQQPRDMPWLSMWENFRVSDAISWRWPPLSWMMRI